MDCGSIVISSDLDKALDYVSIDIKTPYFIFPKPYKEQTDFLVEDADDVIAEAFLAEDGGKAVIIKAATYRQEAQNRLLKLIEEPPSGVRFILLAKNKSSLLPTIRSRLPILSLSSEYAKTQWMHPKNASELIALLKETESWDKETAKLKLKALLDFVGYSGKCKINFELFDQSFTLLSLNSRPQIVFARLLNAL